MVNRVCLYITSSLCFCLSDGVPCFCRNQTSKGSSNRKTTCSSALHWVLPSVNAHTHTHTQADRQTGRERQTHRRHSDRETVWVRDRPAEKKKRRVHSLVYIQGRTLHQCCKNKYLHSRVSLDKYQRDYFNVCR